ncbi:hypothetical protein A9P82_14050 [Arachidicoccus ginsenosidimutans]|uniref:phosphotransferase enzyme family protein n=1 Tax=Arachidicoccus sp. BS20 TaxID=1850526 RepID=UPI0007F0F30B|nr:aminoglycoside phosphotransferase family protein [Arachidicoccus sp. BS20]ANI90316.1 hypothetical protein A9P82_14050 [Arachidicoccus sp. BS20]
MMASAITEAFGIDEKFDLRKLSTGLINQTYKITPEKGGSYLLQQINTKVFLEPLAVQKNYRIIQRHLSQKGGFHLPEIVPARNGELIFTYDNIVWRCFEFIPHTYSPAVSSNPDEAWQVANCFGKFSAELSDLDTKKLSIILPGFHDLDFRFKQFETAVKAAVPERMKEAKRFIEQAYSHKLFIEYYQKIASAKKQYPLHTLHHDCKIANILFKEGTSEIYSPIDLDTTQPGLYFSDFGDMIRSMAPNLSENETNINELIVRKDFYAAIKDGYLHSMQLYLTKEEWEDIDMSGKIIVYMQALRFLTDYLNSDIYYHIDYPEQNKDRAANQFQLLTLLIDYTKHLSEKKIYSGS